MPGKKVAVEDIIGRLGFSRGEMVERLRSMVRKALPEAAETIKWGQPVYVYHSVNLICFMLYEDHVNLGFFVGLRMRARRGWREPAKGSNTSRYTDWRT